MSSGDDAQYSSAVLDHLCREFSEVSLVTFDERVFPGALEDIVLLFASGRGGSPAAAPRLLQARNLTEFVSRR